MKAALVEVFASVQGEGFHTGRFAIFVRLAGCNLSCVFAEGAVCDTPYQIANLKPTVEELFDEIIPPLMNGRDSRAWMDSDYLQRPMLILTGGEPTRHPAFTQIANLGKSRGFYVAVETNGTTWTEGLRSCHWISISPKEDVDQGSPSPHHNKNPQDPTLSPEVTSFVKFFKCGEYRYVVSGRDDPVPPYREAARHYVSPAILSDGSGEEWKTGFPGFVPGAVERCLEIVEDDPRWRLSLQTHKFIGVR